MKWGMASDQSDAQTKQAERDEERVEESHSEDRRMSEHLLRLLGFTVSPGFLEARTSIQGLIVQL